MTDVVVGAEVELAVMFFVPEIVRSLLAVDLPVPAELPPVSVALLLVVVLLAVRLLLLFHVKHLVVILELPVNCLVDYLLDPNHQNDN